MSDIRFLTLLEAGLHKTLYGFIVFGVEWDNVRGINYLNELQTNTSLAIEAKLMRRWEFESIDQAVTDMSQWFSGSKSERSCLMEYLDTTKGEVFHAAEADFTMSSRMGYSKIPLPLDSIPSPIYKRSLSDTFASRSSRVPQETALSLPPRPPVFRRCVSDVAYHGHSRSETDLASQETSEANKILYAIKNGVVELDQWCNKLLQYGEPVSSVKQDDHSHKRLIKEGVRELDQWCNKLTKYGEDSPYKAEVEEEQEKEGKEGVGEAFVVEINCPCGRNYRTLFSGRDCYYKLL